MEATKMLITGPDKELVEALRQQAKRDSINRTPEQREAIRLQHERDERAMQAREDDLKRLRAEAGELEPDSNSNGEIEKKWEMSYNQGLFLVALIFGAFLFLIWWLYIRKARNSIRDLSYTKSEVRSKIDFGMNDSHFEKISDEGRESAEKMRKFLERKK